MNGVFMCDTLTIQLLVSNIYISHSHVDSKLALKFKNISWIITSTTIKQIMFNDFDLIVSRILKCPRKK